MQTSFAVGSHYQKALKDYYDSRESSVITYEPIELEPDTRANTETNSLIKLKIKNLKRALTEHFAPILYFEFFNIHKFIKQQKYEKALKTAKTLLRKFLYNVYKSYYSVNYAVTSVDIEEFIKLMTSVEGFPFKESELIELLARCDTISLNINNLEELSNDMFKSYSTLFNKFKSYTEGEVEGL
jgi:hypothetical protein